MMFRLGSNREVLYRERTRSGKGLDRQGMYKRVKIAGKEWQPRCEEKERLTMPGSGTEDKKIDRCAETGGCQPLTWARARWGQVVG
jgi:hypothetical protein